VRSIVGLALLVALPAFAQPKAEVFAKFSQWAKGRSAAESSNAFIARAASDSSAATATTITDTAGVDYHGVAVAIVAADKEGKVTEVRPLKTGFRTGERFKLRALSTFRAHVIIENINVRGERRQIYPAEGAGVVVLQSGGYALLPLGDKEFFEFTRTTGQELLIISLSDPRAVGDAASRQQVLRVDEKDGTTFIQEVAKGTFPAIFEPIRLEHR